MPRIPGENLAALNEMFRLQDDLNTIIYPDWRRHNFPWRRAIWTECAELVEHLGWKWWKARAPLDAAGMQQARLEIIDVWHFVMSDMMRESVPLAAAGRVTASGAASQDPRANPAPVEDLVDAAEYLAQAALAGTEFQVVKSFWHLASLAGMDVEQVHALYVPKNVLNLFRQANGYKTGGYRKTWAGREDNVHLAEIWEALGADGAPRTAAALTEALEQRYKEMMEV